MYVSTHYVLIQDRDRCNEIVYKVHIFETHCIKKGGQCLQQTLWFKRREDMEIRFLNIRVKFGLVVLNIISPRSWKYELFDVKIT